MNSFKKLGMGLAIMAMMGGMAAVAMPTDKQVTAAMDNSYNGKKAKYVFFFIGDGMAMPQITSTEILKGSASGAAMQRQDLVFTNFRGQGTQTTQALNTFITESAAAGTALATGFKTNNDVLGVDPSGQTKYKSMAKMAKEKGMKVGIISTVSIDHATPAAFYANQKSRSNYYEIALQLSESNFDYFAGGGLLQPTGKKKDQRNALDIAKERGYTVFNTTETILNIPKGTDKVLDIDPNLAGQSAMRYDIDRGTALSLADYTKKGIELLDNKNGFFMMIEGGKIDWAAHANDATSTMRDVVALEEAVKVALEFQAKHPDDTLIVVTGDHETGGMTIGFAGTDYQTYFPKLLNQKMSFEVFDGYIEEYRKTNGKNATLEDWYGFLATNFGMDNFTAYEKKRLEQALAASMIDKKDRPKDDEAKILYGPYEPFSVTVTHILNQRAGIGWTTYAHTGVAVPVFANGTGSKMFDGSYDNTDVARKIMAVMGVR